MMYIIFDDSGKVTDKIWGDALIALERRKERSIAEKRQLLCRREDRLRFNRNGDVCEIVGEQSLQEGAP